MHASQSINVSPSRKIKFYEEMVAAELNIKKKKKI
jgi:hypothetical protein